ncbi:hypothetical protein JCM10213_003493 [Rhodosporidiobolus nylandii]
MASWLSSCLAGVGHWRSEGVVEPTSPSRSLSFRLIADCFRPLDASEDGELAAEERRQLSKVDEVVEGKSGSSPPPSPTRTYEPKRLVLPTLLAIPPSPPSSPRAPSPPPSPSLPSLSSAPPPAPTRQALDIDRSPSPTIPLRPSSVPPPATPPPSAPDLSSRPRCDSLPPRNPSPPRRRPPPPRRAHSEDLLRWVLVRRNSYPAPLPSPKRRKSEPVATSQAQPSSAGSAPQLRRRSEGDAQTPGECCIIDLAALRGEEDDDSASEDEDNFAAVAYAGLEGGTEDLDFFDDYSFASSSSSASLSTAPTSIYGGEPADDDRSTLSSCFDDEDSDDEDGEEAGRAVPFLLDVVAEEEATLATSDKGQKRMSTMMEEWAALLADTDDD